MGELNIVNEIERQKPSSNKTESRYRDVFFSIIRETPPKVFITEYTDSGDMSFGVSIKDLGFSSESFSKYQKEIFSNFVVDFLGEMLIRENLSLFVEHIMAKKEIYLDAVSKCFHKRFGMKIEKGNMYFRFHISLLQGILTEDFKM